MPKKMQLHNWQRWGKSKSHYEELEKCLPTGRKAMKYIWIKDTTNSFYGYKEEYGRDTYTVLGPTQDQCHRKVLHHPENRVPIIKIWNHEASFL